MGVGFSLTMLLFIAITWLLIRGVGIWGIDVPVMWGFASSISSGGSGLGTRERDPAILLLLKEDCACQRPVRRGDDPFAVACEGLFPLRTLDVPGSSTGCPSPQHHGPAATVAQSPGLGRLRGRNLRARSPCSSGRWLIPDLATRRPSEKQFAEILYGMLAMGRRGSARHWHGTGRPTCYLPGWRRRCRVGPPVVSLDFAVGIVPGWHSTIFPPDFVAGGDFRVSPWSYSLHSLEGGVGRHDPITAGISKTWPRSCWPLA